MLNFSRDKNRVPDIILTHVQRIQDDSNRVAGGAKYFLIPGISYGMQYHGKRKDGLIVDVHSSNICEDTGILTWEPSAIHPLLMRGHC